MKINKIVTGIAGFALMAFAIFIMPNLLSKHNKSSKNPIRAERDERESYNDAAKYLWSMRVNPATGRIDISEVEAARQLVDGMANESRNERMKSNSLDLQWEELGPDNIGGRTRAILIDHTNPNLMFAGSVSGGLWKSTDHAQSWYKVDDSQQNLCVSCITQAANGDIYFGTGNGFDFIAADGNSGFLGQGVWKSTDGGNTFNRLASTWTTSAQQNTWDVVNNIYADPDSANIIYAATNQGLQRSNDGGITWINPVRANMTGTQISNTAQTVKVASDRTVLCSVGGQLYISDSTGHQGEDFTFKKVTTVPASNRIEVAIAPSNPNVMYSVGITSGSTLANIYRTTNKFQTVSIIGPGGGSFDPYYDAAGGQGNYDCALAVAPDNQDKIFAVGISAWKWQLDSNWTQMNGYYATNYVHADMHTVIFNPANPSDFFIGTDGGLYETQDQGLTFAAMNRKYNVTQFYSVSSSFVQGATIVIGGTQDNGTLLIDPGYFNYPQDALQIIGGDGFCTATSYYSPNAYFGEVYYAGLGRATNGFGSGAEFFDTHVDGTAGQAGDSAGSTSSFAPFNTPFLLYENTNPNAAMDTSFFLAKNSSLWMTKGALNFDRIPKWYRVANYAFSNNGGSSGPRCMAYTNDGNTVFLGTESPNEVYRISNLSYVNNNLDTSGNNFNLTTLSTPITKTTLSLPTGTSQVPTSISVDPRNNNHVVITLGNYGSAHHVYQSFNALRVSPNPTWTDISPTTTNSSIAIDMPVYSSIIDAWDSLRIIVGTELGVFASEDGGTSWTYQDQLPRVPTFMIKQISGYSNGTAAEDIYIGTHGRGIWRSSTLTGINNTKAGNKFMVNIYPNPTQDFANIDYTMTKSSGVVLDIYSITGQKVKSLDLGTQPVGTHTYNMNLAGLSSGTYIMNATIGDDKSVTKFVITR